MANARVIRWEKGANQTANPSEKLLTSSWIANFAPCEVPNGDWAVTEPIPQDICSDFAINVNRVAGLTDFPLDVEGSVNSLSYLKGDVASWDSIVGSNITWSQSGGTNPTAAGDFYKFKIEENGIMPYLRLSYQNTTGGTINLAWNAIITFERGV
tara:strand:- start:8066 stop:8530 length:465 start_codon:yes stop_codon:yes gene_type:complete